MRRTGLLVIAAAGATLAGAGCRSCGDRRLADRFTCRERVEAPAQLACGPDCPPGLPVSFGRSAGDPNLFRTPTYPSGDPFPMGPAGEPSNVLPSPSLQTIPRQNLPDGTAPAQPRAGEPSAAAVLPLPGARTTADPKLSR